MRNGTARHLYNLNYELILIISGTLDIFEEEQNFHLMASIFNCEAGCLFPDVTSVN